MGSGSGIAGRELGQGACVDALACLGFLEFGKVWTGWVKGSFASLGVLEGETRAEMRRQAAGSRQATKEASGYVANGAAGCGDQARRMIERAERYKLSDAGVAGMAKELLSLYRFGQWLLSGRCPYPQGRYTPQPINAMICVHCLCVLLSCVTRAGRGDRTGRRVSCTCVFGPREEGT